MTTSINITLSGETEAPKAKAIIEQIKSAIPFIVATNGGSGGNVYESTTTVTSLNTSFHVNEDPAPAPAAETTQADAPTEAPTEAPAETEQHTDDSAGVPTASSEDHPYA